MSAMVTIAEACELVTDGTHYTPRDVGAGVPFLTVKDVTDARLDFVGCSFIQEADYLAAKAGNSAPIKGDVLFSKDGTVGKVHVVNTEQSFAVLSSLAILRPKRGHVDAGYLGHVLRSPLVLEDALKKKTGSAIRRIVLSDLKRVKLPLPPLPEQRRIAAILDQAETLRTQRRAALAQFDSLKQSIFLDMFGDPATNPKSWTVKSIDELCEVKGGKRLPKGAEYSATPTPFRYVRVTDLSNGRVDESKLRYLKPEVQREISRYIVSAGNVIISIAGSIGLVAAVPQSLDGANLTENAAKLIARRAKDYLPDFLAFMLGMKAIQDQIDSHVGQVTIGKLALFRIEKLRIPVPPLPLQQVFATRIRAIEALKATHRAALAELDALFSSLQHRAFKGELTQAVASAVTSSTSQARDFKDLFKLDTETGLEALIYVAERTSRNDFYKALKTLYFADKHHLEHHGRLIYGETHCALPMGPVPQAAFDAAKVLSGEMLVSAFPDEALRAALRRTQDQLIPLRTADLRKLGDDQRESLDQAIRYCSLLSFNALKNASHDAAYHRTPANAPIRLEDIVQMLPEAAQRRFFS